MDFKSLPLEIITDIKKKCKDPEFEFYDNSSTIKYIGDFNKKDLFQGYGIYFNEKGKKIYEGYWKNGLMDKIGIFFIGNKKSYEGEWKSGRKHGKGTRYHKNGKVEYNGYWKQGKRNGDGKSFYKNGKLQYNGEWKNDEAEGFGKLYYNSDENNLKYYGYWKKSNYNGEGTLYRKNKTIEYHGVWKNATPVSQLDRKKPIKKK